MTSRYCGVELMELAELIWLIPAFPLLGVLLLLAFGPKLGEPRSGWLATVMMAGSFGATVLVFVGLFGMDEADRSVTVNLFRWIPAGSFSVDVGFLADPLSITMCLFVTGVATLIHLYSIGYMHGDPKFSKFFLYLNLFAFSMLMLVTGSNLLITFLGWEGVGACSYFLVSFWHRSEVNAAAGKKAFVTNRVGDVGFMLGTFLVFTTIGSLNYLDISAAASGIAGTTAVAIGLLFSRRRRQVGPVAAAGVASRRDGRPHSGVRADPRRHHGHLRRVPAGAAQPGVGQCRPGQRGHCLGRRPDRPLGRHRGPGAERHQKCWRTPPSLSWVTPSWPWALAPTAQRSSTWSPAFFKGLLFLGAGSVIHSLNGDQDMRRMGGLRKYLPITSTTFIIGWLAIAGVPPFSGFWSKDDILAGAWEFDAGGKALWAIGLLTALLTAFYMTRQVILVFFGPERFRPETVEATVAVAATVGAADAGAAEGAQTTASGVSPTIPASVGASLGADAEWGLVPITEPRAEGIGLGPDEDPHESPPLMLIPLVVLAGLAVVGGLLSLPFTENTRYLERWLEPRWPTAMRRRVSQR